MRFQSNEVIGAGELREFPDPVAPVEVIMLASDGRREAVAEAVGLVEIWAGTNLATRSVCPLR